MKWIITLDLFLWFLNFEFIVNEATSDSECKESFLCIQSENCQYYQEQLVEITKTERIQTKNDILSNLR